MRANEVWVPLMGDLQWAPLEPAQAVSTRIDPAPTTMAEYNAARLREDLDSLTETFIELWLEANPKMAGSHGHA